MAMSETDANIALCNEALGFLGAKAITKNGSSTNHTYCTLFFDKSRDEVLSSHPWNWGRKHAYAIQTTDPLFGYENAFTVPSDCLRVLTIEGDPGAEWNREGGLIVTDEGSAPPDYDDDSVAYLAGQYISVSDVTYLVNTAFTSSDETSDLSSYCTTQSGDYEILEVEYIYQVTDVSTYPSYLYWCCVLNLAMKLSSPILQDAAPAKTVDIQSMLYGGPKNFGYITLARSYDAQESGGQVIQTNTFIDARK